MSKPLSVLVVEDSEDDLLLLLACLRKAGFTPDWQRVDTAPDLSAALGAREWDLIISDHNMPELTAPQALQIVADRGLDLPFIIVSGSIGEEAAVKSMKAGAQDYIDKSRLARLPAAIERELKEALERRARRTAEERIRFLAFFDPLTGLPNRARFCEQLGRMLADPDRGGSPLAVIGVRLDTLRDIINTLGYATGEQVLLEVATRLKALLAQSHLLARTSADELSVALPDGDVDNALRLCRQVQRELAAPIMVDAMEVVAESSFGVALYPGQGDAAELLLQRTSAALSQACELTSRTAIYDPERDPYQPQRLSLIADLRRAIAGEQMRLHYQPKVDFGSGRITGVEALVRWNHPKLGPLPPDRFIPLAEQTGLINPLTRWVLKEALRQAYAWHRVGFGASIAVNLSAKNLQSPELAEQISRLMKASGVAADKLELEVTESAIMTDHPRARATLEELSAHGIEIAIDDFGTGYSSFANLRKLPVSEIKIDKSFVSGMMKSGEDRAIVDSVIALGHKLDMSVVAEGVETTSIWDALVEMQCDVAQGYYLSRPLPPDDLLHWTRAFVPPTSLVPSSLALTD
jgi:diguanylate cyclase (GGDEF)-like protein